MKFKDLYNKRTEINCPIFGVSYKPTNDEIKLAKNIIIFLEARRVLYNPSEMEMPSHCITSVVEIKNYLTNEMMSIGQDTELYNYVSAMRKACNKFLNTCNLKDDDVKNYGGHWGHWASWYFASALGEMRGLFGVMVLQIAVCYGLDVEDDLASTIPE